MVLIQQCWTWSEWLYLEFSAIPGMTRCNLYDECIFSKPSLGWYNCDSRLWEMESTSNIKILDPLPIHTSSPFWQAIPLCFSSSYEVFHPQTV